MTLILLYWKVMLQIFYTKNYFLAKIQIQIHWVSPYFHLLNLATLYLIYLSTQSSNVLCKEKHFNAAPKILYNNKLSLLFYCLFLCLVCLLACPHLNHPECPAQAWPLESVNGKPHLTETVQNS